jgi:phage-related protein
MREGNQLQPQKLIWVGASKRDLLNLPRDVIRKLGQGLGLVQLGGTPLNAKVLHGFGGASVLELREHDPAGTYRAVYTVRFQDAVYVLHVFQKKARKGIATDQQDVDLIKARLKEAEAHHTRLGASQED